MFRHLNEPLRDASGMTPKKSIIGQQFTSVFSVVKHWAQTDNCRSMSYNGGTALKAWTSVANKGSLHAIQDAA